MRLENHHKPFRKGRSPYQEAANRAEPEDLTFVRVEIELLGGCASPDELADRLRISREDASLAVTAVFARLDRNDFGVPGRGVRLAQLDLEATRALLPLVLGPSTGRKRTAAMKAYWANRAEWDALMDQEPAVFAWLRPVQADTTSAARSSTTPPATPAAVASALERMVERGEWLEPAPVSAQGFNVRHVQYALAQ